MQALRDMELLAKDLKFMLDETWMLFMTRLNPRLLDVALRVGLVGIRIVVEVEEKPLERVRCPALAASVPLLHLLHMLCDILLRGSPPLPREKCFNTRHEPGLLIGNLV